MLEYSVGIECWNTVFEYSVGIQCLNTVLEYSVGIQCWDTVLEYSVGIPQRKAQYKPLNVLLKVTVLSVGVDLREA